MKMRKRIASAVVAGLMMTSFFNVNATFDTTKYFINDGAIVLEGKLLEARRGSVITVSVIDKQVDWLDKEEWENDSSADGGNADKIVYYDALTAGEDGAYKVAFALERNGAYSVYLGCDELAEPVCIGVIYVNEEENETAVAELVSADKSEVEELLKTKYADLGIYDSIYEEAFIDENGEYNSEMLSAVTEDIEAEISELDDRNAELVAEFIYKVILMNMTENEGVDNLYEYKAYLGLDADADELFGKNIGAAVTEELSGESFDDTEDFDEAVVDAIILANVNNSDGIGNVVKIIEAYGDKLGAKKSSATKLASAILKEGDFASVKELKEFIDDYSDSGSTGGSSGSSGGRGNGGGGVTTSKTPSLGGATAVGGKEVVEPGKVSVFDDLAGVEWAEESITQLYWLDVINGKTDKLFAPNDYVTREEFAKMITAAFRMNMVDDEFPFKDVTEADWCYPYVKTAYLAGITKGVSETMFGKGQNIIRQDVCVMLCNAVDAAEYELPSGARVDFADYDEIADYAKTAVDRSAAAGVINGNDGRFMPNSFATRAEAAKMIYYTITNMKSM